MEMRRSVLARCGAGWVSPRGSGRLLVWVIVGNERDDVVRGEAGAAVQVGKLYEEGDAGDGAAGVLDELAHGESGAPGGEQIVGDEDADAFGDRVGVGFEGVGPVLELVGGGDSLAGELVGFTGEDEALAGAVGEGGTEDEAAGLGGEDAVVVDRVGGVGESVYGGVESFTVLYEGGYVLERDAGGREIRDGTDVALEFAGDLVGLAHGHPSGGEGLDDAGHHQLLHARVHGGEVAGLVHGVGDPLLVAAAQLGVQDLLEHRRLAVYGGHDAAQVARLDGVLRHLEGHARDLRVPLLQLAAASDHADGDQVVHEARLDLEGVGQLLAGVGPVFEYPRELAGRVRRGDRRAALDALLDDLERQILFVLERQDVLQKLDVLVGEKPVPAASPAQVYEAPPLEVADLAD